jgi:hypothetical protein
MQEINVTGFVIADLGDPSVGIFDQYWDISGNFVFENESELEEFREKIKELFQWYSGNHKPIVKTAEEIENEEKLYRL